MSSGSILLAFWLGIAFSAPPGIVTVESLRRGLKNGYWSAFVVGLGSLIGDATYAFIAFSGLGFIVQNNIIRFIVSLFGILFLTYLSISCFRKKVVGDLGVYVDSKSINRDAFMTGAVLSLTNPWAIAFWLGFGGILVSSGISTNSQNLWYFLLVFLLGAFSWVVILSGLIVFGKQFISDRIFSRISFGSGLIFLGTACYSFWKLIH